MNTLNYNTNQRKFKQLNEKKRIIIQTLLELGKTQTYIANYLHVHKSTISREIIRGSYVHSYEKGTKLLEKLVYNHDAAQNLANNRKKNSHKKLKIIKHFDYLTYVAKLVKENKYSFEIISGREKYLNLKYNTDNFNVCTKTLYNYLHKGLFAKCNLKPIDLPRLVNFKAHKNYIKRAKRDCKGNSIEIRPEIINNREEPMNWEIDCIVGSKNQGPVLLTLTERKTRFELIYKLESKSSDNVCNVLDDLERKFSNNFSSCFKTITSDNGCEFLNTNRIQSSILFTDSPRTVHYFAHAYCSYERGTNEAMNQRIRQFFPKGYSFDNTRISKILKVQKHLNNQPKKCLGFKTAFEVMQDINPEFIKLVA